MQRAAGQGVEPFQRQRQMGATFVAGHRVDLIHDHRFGRGQELSAPLRGQQDEQRFRRRDQDVGRLTEHAAAFAGRRVARANRNPDLRQGQAFSGRTLPNGT